MFLSTNSDILETTGPSLPREAASTRAPDQNEAPAAPCRPRANGLVHVALTLLWSLALASSLTPTQAAPIPVPNSSFESPRTEFADPRIDAWQKSSEPAWYMGGGGFPWEQLIGQFLNTTNGSPTHIDNMDGNQAAFLFALPDVAIFQDYNSLSGTNTTPTHAFDAKFEPGKSYALAVGVLGGGGGMTNGATFEISLYYVDATGNRITVSATSITNSAAIFPTNTHFTDFYVNIPTVKSSDAWAGKNIGIRLASTVGFDRQGGYWDVDKVRLTESWVPNGSFESPRTDFADPRMDNWQKSSEPAWYMGGGGFPWEQLIGQFLNTTNGSPTHINTMDGNQAAFMFALPEVAMFQDFVTLSGTNTLPTYEFDVKFEPGKSYALTVGVLGGGGGMKNGVTFEIGFYYVDSAWNRIQIGATSITNSTQLFPTNTHFTDFRFVLPPVKPTDAWAGKNVGIRLASTVGFDLQGGYWDVDNVRLDVAATVPALKGISVTGGQTRFTLEGAPGRYEILAASDVTLPLAGWTSLGTVTNETGSVSLTDSNAASGIRFYRARQAP